MDCKEGFLVKRRAAALLLSLFLLFQLMLPPVRAAETVYFMATGIEVRPLSDSTMPFWSGGYLYIPSTIFTGSVRKSLGVSSYINAVQVILYSGDKSLIFNRNQSYTMDSEEYIYYPGMVERNGIAFVPVYLVADFFDLQYSNTPVSSGNGADDYNGYLVWLRRPGAGLTAKQFADAAGYNMASCYAAYLKEKEPVVEEPPVEETPQPIQPQQPEKEPDNETAAIEKPASPVNTMAGKSLYLCLEAGGNTAALLNELDRAGAQAAFFCTPEFLEEEGDLLRRMTASGQSVGILVRDGKSVVEQLERGNQALEAATCGKTRLACLPNGSGEALEAARAAGFRCLQTDLSRRTNPLKSVSHADGLLKRVSAMQGDVSIWLADAASPVGLRLFLSSAEEEGALCLALTETS